MVMQVGLQRRVPLDEFVVVYERRILAQLFGDFRMRLEKIVEPRKFLPCGVVVLSASVIPAPVVVVVPVSVVTSAVVAVIVITPIRVAITILAALEAFLTLHELIRVLLEFLPNRRMILQVILKLRMAPQEIVIIYKRRIAP